eukprot:jgi/Hompol1/7099/HPOL_002940-RA
MLFSNSSADVVAYSLRSNNDSNSTALDGAGKTIKAGDASTGDSSDKDLSMSHAVLSIIRDWETSFVKRPFVLLSSLRLLDLLWQTASDHRSTRDSIRKMEPALWTILGSILFTDPSTAPDGPLSNRRLRQCLIDSVRSFALRIILLEAYFSTGSPGTPPTKHTDTLNRLVSKAFMSKTLLACIFDQQPFPLSATSNAMAQATAQKFRPSLDIAKYCIPKSNLLIEQATLGYNYMFDVDVLKQQFTVKQFRMGDTGDAHGVDAVFTTQQQMLSSLVHLNWEWSMADSRMLFLQSVLFSMRIICKRLWDSVWPVTSGAAATANRHDAANHALLIVKSLSELMHGDQRTEPVIIRYRSVLAGIMHTLVSTWARVKAVAAIKAPAGAPTPTVITLQSREKALRESISAHVEMLGYIQVALTEPTVYGLGPAGVFSSYEFHMELMLAMVDILRAINKHTAQLNAIVAQLDANSTASAILPAPAPSTVVESKLADIAAPIVSFLCHGLSCVLSVDLGKASTSHLCVSIACMVELLQMQDVRASTWISALERFQLIPLMLNVIAKADLTTLQTCWDSFEMVLRGILCMSRSPFITERLAVAGILMRNSVKVSKC